VTENQSTESYLRTRTCLRISKKKWDQIFQAYYLTQGSLNKTTSMLSPSPLLLRKVTLVFIKKNVIQKIVLYLLIISF
jgi:hypothetical protein